MEDTPPQDTTAEETPLVTGKPRKKLWKTKVHDVLLTCVEMFPFSPWVAMLGDQMYHRIGNNFCKMSNLDAIDTPFVVTVPAFSTIDRAIDRGITALSAPLSTKLLFVNLGAGDIQDERNDPEDVARELIWGCQKLFTRLPSLREIVLCLQPYKHTTVADSRVRKYNERICEFNSEIKKRCHTLRDSYRLDPQRNHVCFLEYGMHPSVVHRLLESEQTNYRPNYEGRLVVSSAITSWIQMRLATSQLNYLIDCPEILYRYDGPHQNNNFAPPAAPSNSGFMTTSDPGLATYEYPLPYPSQWQEQL